MKNPYARMVAPRKRRSIRIAAIDHENLNALDNTLLQDALQCIYSITALFADHQYY
jgi:hypothetical protein